MDITTTNTLTNININITEKAILFLKKSLKNTPNAIGVRFSITKSGCSGKSYCIEPISQPNNSDLQFSIADLKIFVDKHSYQFLDGIQIDLKTDGINESLKFINPNARHTCGCGNSFSDTF